MSPADTQEKTGTVVGCVMGGIGEMGSGARVGSGAGTVKRQRDEA